MILSASEGRRAKAEIRRQIERDLRAKAKAKVKELRERIRHARSAQRSALVGIVAQCRAERHQVRARAKEMRRRALEELRAAIRAERAAARGSCSVAKTEARKGARDALERAGANLLAERRYQEDLRRIERGNRARRTEVRRASSTERRSESDDEVRSNIAPHLVSLWERVKRGIRSGPRQSRTEAFLKYVEEHPREALGDETMDAAIADLERQAKDAARVVRKKRYTAAELASVPF